MRIYFEAFFKYYFFKKLKNTFWLKKTQKQFKKKMKNLSINNQAWT